MNTVETEQGSQDSQREQSLIDRMRKGDPHARHALVLAHRALATRYARRYERRVGSAQFEDLFNEGMVGLLEAARRFEPDRGVQFATYARWWVHHFVHRFVQRNTRAVACPNTRAMRTYGARYGTLRRDVEQRVGRKATVSELAQFAGASRDELAQVSAYFSAYDCSYDSLPGDVPATVATAEEQCALAEQRDALGRAIETCVEEMGERAHRILVARHLGQRSQTLRELGEDLGVSRERVRQIERRCLDRIWQVIQEQRESLNGQSKAERRPRARRGERSDSLRDTG